MRLFCRPTLRPTPRPRLRAAALAALLSTALASPVALAPWPAVAQAAAAIPSGVRLPALGEGGAEDFDLNTERRVGEQIMRSIRRDPAYLQDPLLQEGMEALWRPLLDAARQRGEIGPEVRDRFAWEVFLVDDRSVNAFALPGGYVGVHLGLIAITQTRDELASVLAHELSHVTQRHIARSITSAGRQGLAATAAMVLGLILASRADSTDMAQAAIVGSQAAMAQGQINFTREMEREADRIGYEVFTTAGFTAAGMAAMFERLDAANRLNDAGLYPYLRSHPLTAERISEARLRAGTQATASLPTVSHALMQARARVLMDRAEPALRRLQQQAQQSASPLLKEQLTLLAAGAWASTQLRDFAVADALMARLDTLAAQSYAGDAGLRRHLHMMRVLSLAERGDAAAALQGLTPLRDDMSRPALLLRAQVAAMAVRKGAPGASAAALQSVEALQLWLSEQRLDALAWGAMGQVCESLGLTLRALRAQAEQAYAQGELTAAIDRLRAAQRAARAQPSADFVDQSIIESRLRGWEAERRALIAEARGESPP